MLDKTEHPYTVHLLYISPLCSAQGWCLSFSGLTPFNPHYVCGVIISVRREVNFQMRKVVVAMYICPHYNSDLRDNSSLYSVDKT